MDSEQQTTAPNAPTCPECGAELPNGQFPCIACAYAAPRSTTIEEKPAAPTARLSLGRAIAIVTICTLFPMAVIISSFASCLIGLGVSQPIGQGELMETAGFLCSGIGCIAPIILGFYCLYHLARKREA